MRDGLCSLINVRKLLYCWKSYLSFQATFIFELGISSGMKVAFRFYVTYEREIVLEVSIIMTKSTYYFSNKRKVKE